MRSFAWAIGLATFVLVDGYGLWKREEEGICEISEPRVVLVDTTLYWVSSRTLRQGEDEVLSEDILYSIDLSRKIPLSGALDPNLYSTITVPTDFTIALDSTASLFADDNSIHFLSAANSSDGSASIVTYDTTALDWVSHRINVTGDTGAYDGTDAVRDPVIGRSFSLGGRSGNALTIFDASHPEDRAVIENEVDNGAPAMERGNMVEVDYGSEGVLMAFGGVNPTKNGPTENPVYRDLGVLDVYDIKSHKWYQVKATGDIPGNRTDACAVSFHSQDSSQALIYLYGGQLDDDERTVYTDLHVLAVPAFTWIKVKDAAIDRKTPEQSRYAMGCVRFKERQMVALGGTPLGEADTSSLERRDTPDTPDTPDSPDTPDDPNSTADEEADLLAAQEEAEATAENTQAVTTAGPTGTPTAAPVKQQPETPARVQAADFDTPDTPDSPDTPDDPSTNQDQIIDEINAHEPEEGWGTSQPTIPSTQAPAEQAAADFDTPDTPDSPDTPDEPSTNQDQIIDEINAQEPGEGWGNMQPTVPVQQPAPAEQPTDFDTPDTPDSPDTPDDPSTNQDQIIDEINAQEPEEGWGNQQPTVPAQQPAPVEQTANVDTPDTPDSPDTPDDPTTDQDQIIDEINTGAPEEGRGNAQPPAQPAPVQIQAPAPAPQPTQAPAIQPTVAPQPASVQQETKAPVVQQPPASQKESALQELVQQEEPAPLPEVDVVENNQPVEQSEPEAEPEPRPEPEPEAAPDPELKVAPEEEEDSEQELDDPIPEPAMPTTKAPPTPETLDKDEEEKPQEEADDTTDDSEDKDDLEPLAIRLPATNRKSLAPLHTNIACRSSAPPIRILDASTFTWLTDFDPSNSPFLVPEIIFRIIGGDANGGATKTAPSNGWSDPELEWIFKTVPNPGGASTATPDSKPVPAGVIIGATVGAVAALLLLFCLGLFIYFRRRQNSKFQQMEEQPPVAAVSEKAGLTAAGGVDGVMIGGVYFEPVKEHPVELKELDGMGPVGELPQRDHQVYEWSRGAYMHELGTGGEDVKFELEAEPVVRVEMEGDDVRKGEGKRVVP